MRNKHIYIAYWTIMYGEVRRFMRVWTQTLLPPVITAALYYMIFGTFIGSQIASIHGFSYIQFIAPGLVMMSVITSAYMDVVTAFYIAKFQKNIEEIMVAPVPYWIVIAGFVSAGVVRGVLVGGLVLSVALFFTHITVHSIGITVLFLFLTAILFSLGGLINGVYAKGFDSMNIFPTFVLTPLTYLGGVFYSIAMLPPLWQHISLANPILYMINGFRYGFLGVSDVSVMLSLAILTVFILVLLGITIYLFEQGYGLRS